MRYGGAELIEFPVGLIAGIIVSTVVVAMVGAKLVLVITDRYRQHCRATAQDIVSDTDEQRDMLAACTADDRVASADDAPPAPLQSGELCSIDLIRPLSRCVSSIEQFSITSTYTQAHIYKRLDILNVCFV